MSLLEVRAGYTQEEVERWASKDGLSCGDFLSREAEEDRMVAGVYREEAAKAAKTAAGLEERAAACERAAAEWFAHDPARRDGQPASNTKRRVACMVYARTRADGSESFQVGATATRDSATFGSLADALAYRDAR